MNYSQIKKLTFRIFAALGLVGGIVVLLISVRGPASFPTRQALAAITGTVAWVSPDRYGVDFGLEADPRTFFYARKSGDLAAVSSVLEDASRQPITILVKPNKPQQGSANAPFLQVYAFSSRQASLRTLAQVKASWASDYRYGDFAALLAFLAAAAMEYAARRVPPNNSFKPNPLRSTGNMAG